MSSSPRVVPAGSGTRTPRPLQHQLSASDLDAVAHSRAAMQIATHGVLEPLAARLPNGSRDRLYHRLAARCKEDGPRPLDTVALDVVILANLGQTEAQLRAPAAFLDALVDDLFPAAVRRTLDELDLAEEALEARENHLAWRRRVIGETRALLRDEAALNREEAAVQRERARVLDARERELARLGYGDEDVVPTRGVGAATAPERKTPGRVAEAPGRVFSARSSGLQPAAPRDGKVATTLLPCHPTPRVAPVHP